MPAFGAVRPACCLSCRPIGSDARLWGEEIVVQIHATQLFVDDTHVAQPVERATVNRINGGSNPSVGVRFARGWKVDRRE